MEIIESFVEGKSPAPEYQCEDILVVVPDFVAVIDGVTNNTGGTYNGRQPGRFAAETIAAGISNLPRTVDCFVAARELSACLQTALAHAEQDSPGQDPPSATAVIFSAGKRQVWRVGDSHLAINGRAYMGSKEIDRVVAAARSVYLNACLLEGSTVGHLQQHDPSREMLHPIFVKQYLFRNKPVALGYGAFDGSPVPRKYIEFFEVPAGRAEIVLASDGYLTPALTLAQAERHLRQVLLIGPNQETKGMIPGNLSYDDRAYIRIATT